VGRRRIIVQANVRGRDVGSFVAEAGAAIAAEVELAAGYSCGTAGSSSTSSARASG
jgi:cobalt-zinc-cadmium resistance protein CzcA